MRAEIELSQPQLYGTSYLLVRIALTGLFVALVHPLATTLRRSPWTSALLDGVNVAALALMAGVFIQLGQNALIDVLTWAIALVALAVLLHFKIDAMWLFLAGAAVGAVRFWLFK